nr:putative late blight resistance protein homolog R1A-10 [Ipomoea batatas]
MDSFVLITSLLNTLQRNFPRNSGMCYNIGDKESIESLRDKIRNLQAFLEDSHNINKNTRRALESEIRGAARDADRMFESELHQFYMVPDEECRSILYFPKASGLLANYSSQTFPSYPKLLRVLDLSLCDLVDIPNEIVNLVSLRYLALRTNAPLKDYKWSNLGRLQTFVVETIGPNAPGEIWKSPIDILDSMPVRIRNVMFSKSSLYLPCGIRRGLEAISCLYLHPELRECSRNFINIPYVKKLGIYIDITPVSDPKLLPMDSSQQHSSLNDLVDLHHLENLKINLPQIIHYQDAFRLPTSFPLNLKKLTLKGTCFPWDDMVIIATLPKLEALKLKHKAFCGSEWKTTGNGFCKLKYLKMAVLDFEHWSAYFPVLECLILDFCRKLKKFPIEFADITTLQLIELTRCDSFLVTSAKQIHEEQLECLGYTKLVIRDYCTFS